jgi:hypothetical protein
MDKKEAVQFGIDMAKEWPINFDDPFLDCIERNVQMRLLFAKKYSTPVVDLATYMLFKYNPEIKFYAMDGNPSNAIPTSINSDSLIIHFELKDLVLKVIAESATRKELRVYNITVENGNLKDYTHVYTDTEMPAEEQDLLYRK